MTTDLPAGHPLLSRVVADAATDPAGWAAARPYQIGASDAAGYAKWDSRDKYLARKLGEQPASFGGSQYTRNGHAHEPGLMGFAGLAHNARTFHHEEYREFTATPDGLRWSDAGVLVLGEGKIKHHIVEGPTPAEFRQVVWAQYVTGARMTRWVKQTMDPRTNRPYGVPIILDIPFNPDLLAPMLEIAHYVRRGMIAAREFGGTP